MHGNKHQLFSAIFKVNCKVAKVWKAVGQVADLEAKQAIQLIQKIQEKHF